MKDFKSLKINKIGIMVLSIIVFFLLFSGIVYAKTGTSSDSSSSNFSIQNVITAVKNFDAAGKKTDGGIDAKAMGDKFAEQLKPIGDIIITVGMIVCVAVSIIFGMKFVAASGKGQEIAKLKTQLLGFVIASFVFVSAYPIWSFIVKTIAEMVAKV